MRQHRKIAATVVRVLAGPRHDPHVIESRAAFDGVLPSVRPPLRTEGFSLVVHRHEPDIHTTVTTDRIDSTVGIKPKTNGER
jgi:hypothetical protein